MANNCVTDFDDIGAYMQSLLTDARAAIPRSGLGLRAARQLFSSASGCARFTADQLDDQPTCAYQRRQQCADS